MNERFERMNMAGAVFRDVNLAKAEFDDVNLGEAVIHNANLSNLSIDDANIQGLTIFGFRIDELISAEMDRRDPMRIELRMRSCYDPASLQAVMARLDEFRANFIDSLYAQPRETLLAAPQPGQWSVIDNIRHLMFAEDMYIHRWILRDKHPWCRMGLRSAFLDNRSEFAEVGTLPEQDLDILLAAWAEIHSWTKRYVAMATEEDLRRSTQDVDFGQGTVGMVLQGMAQHDLDHIRQCEAVLDRQRS